MKTFRINDKYQIVCEYANTRNGFKHTANLLRTGLSGTTVLIQSTKVCYLNRTWESFEYETVIRKLLSFNTDIPKGTQTRFLNKISDNESKRTKSMFQSVAMVAKIGELLTDNQKDSNDWKKRMLSAGLTGLSIPEDWNELTEDEKTKRLDNVISECNK